MNTQASKPKTQNSGFRKRASRFSRRGFRVVRDAVMLLLVVSSTAYAHKVSIYAYAEDGMIHAEGYFADGTRSRNSRIEVFDAKTGEKLLEGRTDDEGRFTFKIPKVTPIRLVLLASMGHRNDYTIDEEEVRKAMGLQAPAGGKAEKTERGSGHPPSPAALPAASPGEIEAVVSRVLERKLQPVTTMLLKLQEESGRPGVTEILGGIGYIIGLMGMAMYFKGRNRK